MERFSWVRGVMVRGAGGDGGGEVVVDFVFVVVVGDDGEGGGGTLLVGYETGLEGSEMGVFEDSS